MEFLLLLFMAVLVRYLWGKYLPLVAPRGRLYPTLAAYLGALGGGLLQRFFLPWGPHLFGVYFIGALLGSVLVLFCWGVGPFIRVLLRGR